MEEKTIAQLKRDICDYYLYEQEPVSIHFLLIQPENNEIAQVQFTLLSSTNLTICFGGRAGYINNQLFLIAEILSLSQPETNMEPFHLLRG